MVRAGGVSEALSALKPFIPCGSTPLRSHLQLGKTWNVKGFSAQRGQCPAGERVRVRRTYIFATGDDTWMIRDFPNPKVLNVGPNDRRNLKIDVC